MLRNQEQQKQTEHIHINKMHKYHTHKQIINKRIKIHGKNYNTAWHHTTIQPNQLLQEFNNTKHLTFKTFCLKILENE